MSRGIDLPSNYAILSTVDRDIFSGDDRTTEVVEGFELAGSHSHVLLAGCSEAEKARESSARGHFTQALLNLLRNPIIRIDNISYQDVMDRLPDLPQYAP
jgi:hypothetical protein